MGRAGRPNHVAAYSGWQEVEGRIDWSSPRLVLPVGLPGSGKSTWAAWVAERQDCAVVSADAVRLELFSDLQEANRGGRENHARVFALVHERLRDALRDGHVAIADATNLYPRARQPLHELAAEEGVPVEIVLFDNADAALSRNSVRSDENRVPEEPMRRMSDVLKGIESALQREGRLHRISS